MERIQHEPVADRRGFVLVFVVMMLFAISVAGATGYLVVKNEVTSATYSSQGAEALAIARAGLHRFVAEQIGVVGDDVPIAIGNGIATITTRRLAALDTLTDVYYVRSEGRISDLSFGGIPATRVVGAYAIHHRRPLAHHAALVLTSPEIDLGPYDTIWANDMNTSSDCAGGGTFPITGVVTLTENKKGKDEAIMGSPEAEAWGTFDAVYDSIGLRWDVLTDPDFPVDFQGPNPPDWTTVPTDSFPVVRYNGSTTFDASWSGRGVLIVTGTFMSDGAFRWRGIVLAGEVSSVGNPEGFVDGMFVGGLNGQNPMHDDKGTNWNVTTKYYSCNVYAANESLSYLELIPNTLFEAF